MLHFLLSLLFDVTSRWMIDITMVSIDVAGLITSDYKLHSGSRGCAPSWRKIGRFLSRFFSDSFSIFSDSFRSFMCRPSVSCRNRRSCTERGWSLAVHVHTARRVNVRGPACLSGAPRGVSRSRIVSQGQVHVAICYHTCYRL